MSVLLLPADLGEKRSRRHQNRHKLQSTWRQPHVSERLRLLRTGHHWVRPREEEDSDSS
jgi:hypothetical protein